MSLDPASYVEGVPVKITEKFRPPRKVSLSSSCNYQINTDVLTDEYDFVVEHDALNWLENYKKRKEISLNQRKCNIKEYEESKKKIIEEEKLKHQRKLAEEEARVEEEKGKLQEENERSSDEEIQERSLPLENGDESINNNELTPEVGKSLDCGPIKLNSEEKEIVPVDDVSIINEEQIDPIYSGCNENISNQYSFENHNPNMYNQQPYPSVLVPTQCTTQLTHQRSPSKANLSINFADFEGDASDPFDSVALKSINDMEELAKILQTTSNCTNSNFSHPGQYSNGVFPNSQYTYMNYHQPNNPNPFTNVPSSYPKVEKLHDNISHVPVSLNSDVNYHSTFLQSYNPWKNFGSSRSEEAPNYHFKSSQYDYQISPAVTTSTPAISKIVSNSVVPNCEDNPPSHVNNAMKTGDHVPLSINKRQDLEDFYTRYYSPPKPQSYGIRSGENTPTSTNLLGSRAIRSSSSVPDLSASDDSEVSGIVSSFEPVRVNLKPSVSNPSSRPSSAVGIEGYKVYHKQNNASSSSTSVKHRLHDPFTELTIDAQTLVQSLAEMGFPRPRVARAVQKLGTDHKKLLEVLLTLQSFQESGEDEYRSESAFYFYMGDVAKVQDFLTASKTLLDLGFDEEDVTSNLFKHQNDKDKCLEELIS